MRLAPFIQSRLNLAAFLNDAKCAFEHVGTIVAVAVCGQIQALAIHRSEKMKNL